MTGEEVEALRTVSTASLTTALFNRGIRTAHLHGVQPVRPDLRLVGYAYTLRYIPMREDLGGDTTFDNTTNPQRVSVEDVGPGDVLVIDARGEIGAGVLGDILITRMQQRGVAGIVTDGAFRDTPSIREIELPTYSRASAPYMSSIIHHPVETNTPIGCGGAAIIPGDVIVGDGEGVVVLPRAMAGEIAREAFEKEQYEDWALKRIQTGSSILDVYPPSEETLAEYQRVKE
ncbi:ribonuclease activity regulator RraA [soil metagenome]